MIPERRITLLLSLLLTLTIGCEESTETHRKEAQRDFQSSSLETSGELKNSEALHREIGSPIALETARDWIANYRKDHPTGPRSRFIGAEALQNLLDQKDIMGVSIFYAKDEKGIPQLVFVGVDSQGNLMKSEGVGAMDATWVCPPHCPEGDI